MKKTVLLLSILLIGFAFLTESCDKDGTEVKVCNLERDVVLDDDMDLVFKVEVTDNANCSQISYSIAGEEQIIDDPTLPWTFEASALLGDAIVLSADATALDGSVKISIKGSGTNSSISLEDSCSQTAE